MYVVQVFEVNSMILLILEHIVKDKNKNQIIRFSNNE